MSTAITVTPGNVQPIIPRNLDDVARMAAMAKKSGLAPKSLQSVEAVGFIIMKGLELGITPMAALTLINNIAGQPTISPQGMLGLIHSRAEVEDIKIVQEDGKCSVTMHRSGLSPHTEVFTMQMASRMQTYEKGKSMPLTDKYNWRQMPEVMLKWRAVAACARVVFPDVIHGLYLHEEMGATVDAEGEIIEHESVEVEALTDEQEIEAEVSGMPAPIAKEHTVALHIEAPWMPETVRVQNAKRMLTAELDSTLKDYVMEHAGPEWLKGHVLKHHGVDRMTKMSVEQGVEVYRSAQLFEINKLYGVPVPTSKISKDFALMVQEIMNFKKAPMEFLQEPWDKFGWSWNNDKKAIVRVLEEIVHGDSDFDALAEVKSG